MSTHIFSILIKFTVTVLGFYYLCPIIILYIKNRNKVLKNFIAVFYIIFLTIPKTIKTEISIHKKISEHRINLWFPVLIYFISSAAKIPTISGNVIKSALLYPYAVTKSSLIMELNILVMPQAGHSNPVKRLKMQGIAIPKFKITI